MLIGKNFRTRKMKHFFYYIVSLLIAQWLESSQVHAQDMGTSPLEYNPSKVIQKEKETVQNKEFLSIIGDKSLYPIGGATYYFYDTVNIPFIDDFSKDYFKKYTYSALPTPYDSSILRYRLIPHVVIPFGETFKYMEEPTFTYDKTSNMSYDSTANPMYKLVFYGDATNPFVALDTIDVWPITTVQYYINNETSLVDSINYFPDGSVNADSLRDIKIFPASKDGALWVDNYTYRNNSMAVKQPTYGVVTFDGTNEFGVPYKPGLVSAYGVADYLTSKPIHLNYLPSDSLYLSFFYQPQGLGAAPAGKDSLVVEFLNVTTGKWQWAWSAKGSVLDTFKVAMIAIKDTNYLKSGFQFRFKNYANLSGNLSHWNVDYVRLDANRNFADTLINDRAFVVAEPSILRRYMEMPYTQVVQAEINPKWENKIVNLDEMPRKMYYAFDVENEAGTVLDQYPFNYTPLPSDTNFIQPYGTNGYTNIQRWSNPDFSYQFDVNGDFPLNDSASYYIKHAILNLESDINSDNDTLIVRQNFYNAFAYDDGTAEEAFWLGNIGYASVLFKNNFPDTLRAVQFYFTPVKENIENNFIDIMVWQGGGEDSLLYKQRVQIKINADDQNAFRKPENNGFSTYILEEPVALAAGDFYVGWFQPTNFKINIGFDKNTPERKQYMAYNTSNQWHRITADGSLMIRPLLGPPIQKSTLVSLPEEMMSAENVNLFPNPTSQTFQLDGLNDELYTVQVLDLTGKVLLQETNYTNLQSISIDHLPASFYIVRLHNTKGNVIVKKLVKN